VTFVFWLLSAKPTENKEEDGAAAEEGTEEEPKVMTLDEWKALQAANRVKPEYNIRKPGEGCSNDPQWKKMVALTRKNPKEQSEDDEEEEYEEDKHAKSKTVLPIEITFTDNPRRGGRGGRRGGGGDRGGGRGGGGRGYPADGGYRNDLRKSPSRRGDRESGGGGRRGARERAPNVADEHDFPSLDKAVPVQ
jgi:plasminogen activator inhibitor 1 RNA-binding protein